jgi:hypothetical protein
MLPVLANELEILSAECAVVLQDLIASCVASRGDLSKAEEAMGSAISRFRSIVVTGSTRVCVASADRSFHCPDCGRGLTHWETTLRHIVTSSGEGQFPSERYRCRSCKSSWYPWQTAHGLDGKNQFTLSARQLIAEEASRSPFDEASVSLQRMGLSVSPSEVDRIAQEVGEWRKQEQEVVRSCSARGNLLSSLPMHDWSRWPDTLTGDDVVVFSVDGAKVRSIEQGPKGLEWFEVRSGIIRLSRDDKPNLKVCLAGVLEADKLFEMMRSQWWQSRMAWNQKGGRPLRMVFVADGAEWIWERAGWYFPHCIQILDIYHAAQHLASAGRAAWGPEDARGRRWIDEAIPWLLEDGAIKEILRQLIDVLRAGHAANIGELQTEFRYLWRHRHRMRYSDWKLQGLPIGSGAMESTIKQICTHRLRRAGMKWTRANADLIINLRAAVQSDALRLTFQRERQIRLNKASVFKSMAA